MNMHRHAFKMLLALALVLALAAGAFAQSASPQGKKAEVSEVQPVTLESWRDSTDQTRYAFLIGFVTMMELEKNYQGRNGPAPLPLKQSLIGAWSVGLSDLTLKEIFDQTNDYIEKNPGQLKRLVVDYWWYTYAQPKIDAARKK